MGESQAFPWEGCASRSELNEMIACGNHTLKRDGAEQSEADEAETSSYVLTVFSPPAPTSSGLRATFSPKGRRLEVSAFRVYVQLSSLLDPKVVS